MSSIAQSRKNSSCTFSSHFKACLFPPCPLGQSCQRPLGSHRFLGPLLPRSSANHAHLLLCCCNGLKVSLWSSFNRTARAVVSVVGTKPCNGSHRSRSESEVLPDPGAPLALWHPPLCSYHPRPPAVSCTHRTHTSGSLCLLFLLAGRPFLDINTSL